MQILGLTIFLVCSTGAFSSDVVVLTADNFEHETQVSTGATTGDWMVEFYAPWCGHCRKLEPIWEEIATKLKGDVNVAKVDVTMNGKLGKRFGIQGFPTILLFHKGKSYKYSGKRTAEQLTEFAKGGFKESDGEEVPALPGLVEELTGLVTGALKRAQKDMSQKQYLSPNVIVLVFPFLFIAFILLIVYLTPGDVSPPPAKSTLLTSSSERKESASGETTATGLKEDAGQLFGRLIE
eukprot:gene1948-3775_t